MSESEAFKASLRWILRSLHMIQSMRTLPANTTFLVGAIDIVRIATSSRSLDGGLVTEWDFYILLEIDVLFFDNSNSDCPFCGSLIHIALSPNTYSTGSGYLA